MAIPYQEPMQMSGIHVESVTLRRGEPRDLPFLYRLERMYMEDLEKEQLQGWQNAMEHHLGQWLDALPRSSIAVSGDEPAGYIFWEERDDTAVVASVNVAPEHRRRGLGVMLLRRFEAEARDAGLHLAQVGVVRHNPARMLYDRLGYRKVSEEGRYDIMMKHV